MHYSDVFVSTEYRNYRFSIKRKTHNSELKLIILFLETILQKKRLLLKMGYNYKYKSCLIFLEVLLLAANLGIPVASGQIAYFCLLKLCSEQCLLQPADPRCASNGLTYRNQCEVRCQNELCEPGKGIMSFIQRLHLGIMFMLHLTIIFNTCRYHGGQKCDL
jgi:hypothetical protein